MSLSLSPLFACAILLSLIAIRAGTIRAYVINCGPVLLNPLCQLSLWEKTGDFQQRVDLYTQGLGSIHIQKPVSEIEPETLEVKGT